MRRPSIIGGIVAALVLGSFGASAQQHPGQPYGGFEMRPVKSLSEKQTADLRAGRGMGLALPAELNGYPGPSHTLELGDQLALTDGQRADVQALFNRMKSEAVPIGERLIAQETELDHQFATRTVTPESLEAATRSIAAMQGELRNGHLRYHLLTLAVLTPAQVQRYAELRGYAQLEGGDVHHGGPH